MINHLIFYLLNGRLQYCKYVLIIKDNEIFTILNLNATEGSQFQTSQLETSGENKMKLNYFKVQFWEDQQLHINP